MPSTTQSPRPAPTTRDPWFDNAKMALVTLVVVGHSWTLLPTNGFNDTVYDALYAWHVPAFVFVTGYLSRSFEWQRVRLWRLFRTVVVPYFIFESLLALFRVYVGGETLDSLFTDPHWPMWYLSALFFWRMLTPIFKRLPLAVPVAVVISLVAGAWAGDTFDIARVLGLLPFFVAGLKATPETLERIRGGSKKPYAVAVLVALAVAATWTDSWAATEWLYYRARYDELVGSDLTAIAIRAAVLAMGTLGAMAFLALVPRINGWFTRMGSWTLVVYLFHGFVIKGAEYAGYMGWAADHPVLSFGLTTVAAVVLALFLAWTPVASRLNALVDPLGIAERKVKEVLADDSEDERAEEREPVKVG